MLNFKVKISLLATSALLLSSSVTYAMNDYNNGMGEDEAFEYVLRMSAEAAEQEAEFRRVLALSAQDAPQQQIPQRVVRQPVLEPKVPVQQLQIQQPIHQPVLEVKAPVQYSEELIALANYIRARPGAIRTPLSMVVDTHFQFVDMPICAAFMGGINLPPDPLNLEGIKDEAQIAFKRFCEDKNFNYEVALPLFSHFWKTIFEEHLPPHHPFFQTYKKVWDIVATNKGQINELLVKVTTIDAQEPFKQLMQGLGIKALYDQLSDQKDIICDRIISPLTKMPPQELLAQGPAIDTFALTGKVTIVNQLHVPEVIEKKKPQFIEKHRPALENSILQFQGSLTQEFEKRQRNRGGETVMIFGNEVAKNYYKKLDEHINTLWNLLGFRGVLAERIENIDKITELCNTVKGKDDLELSGIHIRDIKSSLDTSFSRHNEPTQWKREYYLGDRQTTQYDYLLMVSTQVSRFNKIMRENDKVSANTLLGSFFGELIDQKGKCQPGMIGRLLGVHKKTLDMLIEYYQTPELIQVVEVVPVEEKKDPVQIQPNPIIPVVRVGEQTYQERLQDRWGKIGPKAQQVLLGGGDEKLKSKLFQTISSRAKEEIIEIIYNPGSNFFMLRINNAIQGTKYLYTK